MATARLAVLDTDMNLREKIPQAGMGIKATERR
jgi:hypothetical protein